MPSRTSQRTAALILSLDLCPGDFVFLLDENELRDPERLHGLAVATSRPALTNKNKQSSKTRSPPSRLARSRCFPYTMEKQGI